MAKRGDGKKFSVLIAGGGSTYTPGIVLTLLVLYQVVLMK